MRPQKKDNGSRILFNSTPLLYSVERSSKLQITVRIRKDRFRILFFEERVDLIHITAYTTRAWHLEFKRLFRRLSWLVFYIIQLLTAQGEKSSSTENNIPQSYLPSFLLQIKINKQASKSRKQHSKFYLPVLLDFSRATWTVREKNQAAPKRDRLRSSWFRKWERNSSDGLFPWSVKNTNVYVSGILTVKFSLQQALIYS